MKSYKPLTRDEVVAKTKIGKTLGFPIPNENVILTDLVALMEYRGGETVCALAFTPDGEKEFAVSFSALTRWGVESDMDNEDSDRFGMFAGVSYDTLFGDQLKFRWHLLNVSEKQELFIPKWDKEKSQWDFDTLKKREYPKITTKKCTANDLEKVRKLYESALKSGWISFYNEKFNEPKKKKAE